MQPLVSVIAPAFNAGQTLREAVESVLAGTYKTIEVIIVDDGSTDSTSAVAEELARSDSRVTLHRRGNGGVSAALNSGLALATGEFVSRLDADDLWHPAKLDRQVEATRTNRQAALIYTWVRYIDAEGRVVRDGPRQRFPGRSLCRGIYESLVGGNSSALIRRQSIQDVGGYDEALSSWEDLLLQLRISEKHPIDYVPEFLVGYRVRPGSLSATPHNMLASWRTAREMIETYFPQVPRFVRDWANGRRCAELAESFAWNGDHGTSGGLLAEAMRSDPQWTTRWLAYRTVRTIKRRISRPENDFDGPNFLDCDPTEDVRPPEQVLPSLEKERIPRLTALDAELAR